MIRSEAEYREAVTRLEEDRRFIQLQREALEAKGYAPHEVAAGLEPTLAFHEQLADDVAWYERVKQHDFEAVVSRDERNEYHGIGVERAQRIFDALGAQIVTTVETIAAPSIGEATRPELIST